MATQEKNDPKDVSVDDGLAKLHQAAQRLTEEDIEELADEARQAAQRARKETDD